MILSINVGQKSNGGIYVKKSIALKEIKALTRFEEKVRKRWTLHYPTTIVNI